MTYLDEFLNFINSLPDILVYVVLALSSFLENIFPPAPGDTVTAFGAFLVATGRLHFFGVLASTTLGSLGGFMFLFWIGRLLGKRFFIVRDYRYFSKAKILRAEKWFKKYGSFLILINRFLPGIRSVISLVAGILKLNGFKVGCYALISCILWNLLWIGLGLTVGLNWENAKAYLSTFSANYTYGVLALFCLLTLGLLIKKMVKR